MEGYWKDEKGSVLRVAIIVDDEHCSRLSEAMKMSIESNRREQRPAAYERRPK